MAHVDHVTYLSPMSVGFMSHDDFKKGLSIAPVMSVLKRCVDKTIELENHFGVFYIFCKANVKLISVWM